MPSVHRDEVREIMLDHQEAQTKSYECSKCQDQGFIMPGGANCNCWTGQAIKDVEKDFRAQILISSFEDAGQHEEPYYEDEGFFSWE